MKHIAYTLIRLTALFSASIVFASGAAAANKTKTAICASYHGADCISTVPTYPTLLPIMLV